MAVTDDFYIDNQPGAPFRAELNTILAALANGNSGSTEPPNPQPGIMWLDTSSAPWVLKRRNSANTGWIEHYDTSNKPSKADVGLSNVPNFTVTSSLADGSTSKFSTAKAAKDLEDKKLNKTAKAADAAKLGGVAAASFALQTGNYSGLRARATIKSDVGLSNVANYTASSSLTLNSNTSYALSSSVFALNTSKLNKTEEAADSAKLGGKLPAAYAASVHNHGADDLPTATVSAKGMTQLLDSVTSASTARAAVPKSVKAAYDTGVKATTLAKAAKSLADSAYQKTGGNLSGAINYTTDIGNVITLDNKTVMYRHSVGGAVSFGADQGLVIGSGESRNTTVQNIAMTAEVLHLSSDFQVVVRTNMQAGWASRKESVFEADGGFLPGNAAKTRANLDVPNVEEVKKISRIVGEICYFSFDTPPPGFFSLDGSTVVNGKIDFPALANSGSRFISISGNNIVLKNAPDFIRGKGSSGRDVGAYTADSFKSHNHTLTLGATANSGNSGGTARYCASGQRFFTATATTTATGGSETAPKSLTALICIYHGVI